MTVVAVTSWQPALRFGLVIPLPLTLGLTVLAYLPLAIWHRKVRLVFGIQLIFSLVAVAFSALDPSFGILLALFRLIRRSSRRVGALGMLGASVVIAGVIWNYFPYVEDYDLSVLLVNVGVWSAALAVLWILGRRFGSLARRADDAEQALAEAQEAARRKERVQIARELHDIVSHSLSAIVLQSAGARRLEQRSGQSNPQVDEALGSIEHAGSQAMRELHRLLGLMRGEGSELEELAGRHLAELPELVSLATSAGLQVTVDVTGEPVPLDPSLDHAAFRVAQESLSNAMKHAGRGSLAAIAIDWGATELRITVRSSGGTGRGTPLPGGHGLIGLAERLQVVGGSLRAEPDGDAFVTEATLPLTRG